MPEVLQVSLTIIGGFVVIFVVIVGLLTIIDFIITGINMRF